MLFLRALSPEPDRFVVVQHAFICAKQFLRSEVFDAMIAFERARIDARAFVILEQHLIGEVAVARAALDLMLVNFVLVAVNTALRLALVATWLLIDFVRADIVFL